jgi:hypothetical protein
VTADGRFSLGGGADAGREAAQLAIMPSKANGASLIKGLFGVIGAPRPDLGAGGDPAEIQGLSMMDFETAGLNGDAGDLEAAGGRVGLGCPGADFGRLQPSAGPVEGVPAESERLHDEKERGDGEEAHDQPAGRLQHGRQAKDPHGNTFRSSSK